MEDAYDISVILKLPPSPTNLNLGNFMVTIHLLEAGGNPPVGSPRGAAIPSKNALVEGSHVVNTFRRPVLLTYVDPIVQVASRLLLLPYRILRQPRDIITLTTSMLEMENLAQSGPKPNYVMLELEAAPSIQVYSASIVFKSQLYGVRWYMYHWQLTCFVFMTLIFWAIELIFTLITFWVLSTIYSRSLSNVGAYSPKYILN